MLILHSSLPICNCKAIQPQFSRNPNFYSNAWVASAQSKISIIDTRVSDPGEKILIILSHSHTFSTLHRHRIIGISIWLPRKKRITVANMISYPQRQIYEIGKKKGGLPLMASCWSSAPTTNQNLIAALAFGCLRFEWPAGSGCGKTLLKT